MKLFTWLLGPLSLREQLALPARFLGWLFGPFDDRRERPQLHEPSQLRLAVPPRADNSPGNSPPRDPRPKAAPLKYCVVLHHRTTGRLIGVGAAELPTFAHAIAEANYFNAGCTLPIVASPAVLTRHLRRHRDELNKVQLLTTIEVIDKIQQQAATGAGDGGQGTGQATLDLPHGAPPDASMPTGDQPVEMSEMQCAPLVHAPAARLERLMRRIADYKARAEGGTLPRTHELRDLRMAFYLLRELKNETHKRSLFQATVVIGELAKCNCRRLLDSPRDPEWSGLFTKCDASQPRRAS